MKDNVKSYPVPWQGQLILASRKCQKKLKGDLTLPVLAKLKKTIKRRNMERPDLALHIINVPCMDLCPKDGVTVCYPARDLSRLIVLRSVEDIEMLFHAS
jgi:hypothetical protein